jgi:hypothetical protein
LRALRDVPSARGRATGMLVRRTTRGCRQGLRSAHEAAQRHGFALRHGPGQIGASAGRAGSGGVRDRQVHGLSVAQSRASATQGRLQERRTAARPIGVQLDRSVAVAPCRRIARAASKVAGPRVGHRPVHQVSRLIARRTAHVAIVRNARCFLEFLRRAHGHAPVVAGAAPTRRGDFAEVTCDGPGGRRELGVGNRSARPGHIRHLALERIFAALVGADVRLQGGQRTCATTRAVQPCVGVAAVSLGRRASARARAAGRRLQTRVPGARLLAGTTSGRSAASGVLPLVARLRPPCRNRRHTGVPRNAVRIRAVRHLVAVIVDVVRAVLCKTTTLSRSTLSRTSLSRSALSRTTLSRSALSRCPCSAGAPTRAAQSRIEPGVRCGRPGRRERLVEVKSAADNHHAQHSQSVVRHAWLVRHTPSIACLREIGRRR